MPEPLTLEAGPKLVAYLATLLSVGATVTLGLSRAAEAPRPWPADSPIARARRLAMTAGAAALVALGLRAAAHAVLIAGSPDAVTADTLRLAAIESRWGAGWRWQVLAAAVVTLAAWRARNRAGIRALAFAVTAWCVATPALGHGASTIWQRVVHALHLGASGAWIGTVLVLACCLGGARGPARVTDLQGVVHRFSPWALAAAAMVGASGAILALTYVGGIAGLLTTPYGRLLIAKLAGVTALGACGFGNWQRSRADRPPSPALIRSEAILALLVLLVTTLLTETEHN